MQPKTSDSPIKSNPTVDLNAINPTLHRYHTAHLRRRHGVIDYENTPYNSQKDIPKFWTLPNRAPFDTNGPRTVVSNQRIPNYPIRSIVKDCYGPTNRQGIPSSNDEESVRISPIDPRASGPFKSSTPTNKDNVIDLSSKLLSPVKSTMTNEELYAVIHKSKKKLNIKETPERAESPALSSISLSPVSSETSLYSKRQPETGYLGDPKSRGGWSPMENPFSGSVGTFGLQKSETTCADRFGPIPQTSRLDFKKLLLQHSVKLNTLSPQNKSNKLSAVEQLKLSKEKTQIPTTPVGNRSQVNILDLSGSPKTYTNRKVIKSNNLPSSPGRTSALIKEHKNTPKILLSPKSQWRFASPRSDVLSSPIPEANNEEENSNSSGEKHDGSSSADPPSKTVPIITNQHFGARRNLIPITEHNVESEHEYHASCDQGVFPLEAEYSKSHGLSRSEILQAKRAEFFSSPPEKSPPKFTSFKSQSTTQVTTRNQTSPERGKTSPTTLETAL